MNDLKNRCCSELGFIRGVLTRSEFSYRRFRSFFLFLAIYLPLMQLLCGMLHSEVLQRLLANEVENALFWQAVSGGACRLILLLPMLLVWIKLRKGVRAENRGLSLWLFDTCGFTVLFCGLAVAVVMAATQDMSLLSFAFSCFSCGLSMFLCGYFTGKQRLKTLAILYLAVLVLLLAGFGAVNHAVAAQEMQNLQPGAEKLGEWVAKFLNVQSAAVFFYPMLGYGVLALWLREPKLQPPDTTEKAEDAKAAPENEPSNTEQGAG